MLYIIVQLWENISSLYKHHYLTLCLWPNPICMTKGNKQIDGRLNATSTKFTRPQGVSKFVLRDCGFWENKLFRGDSEGDTPVPMPNTEVKPFSADGTWREAAWESRSLRNYYSEVAQRWSTRLLTGRLVVRIHSSEPNLKSILTGLGWCRVIYDLTYIQVQNSKCSKLKE